MSSLKSLLNKVNFLTLSGGGVSAIPILAGSAPPSFLNSTLAKSNIGSVFDKNQRFGKGGCHYWVEEEEVKKAYKGKDWEKILNASDASVQGGGDKKLWVVYENPFEATGGGCHAGSQINENNAQTTEANVTRKKYLLISLGLKDPNANKDVVVMYNSPTTNQRNKWRGVGNDGKVKKEIIWKSGGTNASQAPRGWTPTHAVLCIPKSDNGKKLAKKGAVLGHSYNPKTGKCQNEAVKTEDLKSSESNHHLTDELQIGGPRVGSKRNWAQKWWDHLTWIELK